MSRSLRLAIASIMGLTLLVGAPTVAFAQQEPPNISIEMEQADVREALRAIFKGAGLNYSVAPEVQGTVTVSLKQVPFETALQNVLRQVNATYRVSGGVYEVINREEITVPDRNDAPVELKDNTVRRRVYTRHADPQLVAKLISRSGTDFVLAPEQSTIVNSPRSGGGFGNNSFGGGRNSGNNGSFNPGDSGRGSRGNMGPGSGGRLGG